MIGYFFRHHAHVNLLLMYFTNFKFKNKCVHICDKYCIQDYFSHELCLFSYTCDVLTMSCIRFDAIVLHKIWDISFSEFFFFACWKRGQQRNNRMGWNISPFSVLYYMSGIFALILIMFIKLYLLLEVKSNPGWTFKYTSWFINT